MRVVKPGWVSHDGKPIFSLDIHPDGSRFVTGGQGDDYGKIVIWNMAPVRDEALEADDKVPKILCQMDNHFACVNVVRWSHNGKFLASGGDDKLVMIWQTSRGAGPSKAFGSTGSVVIYEQWRPVFTLRGHTGDVLDLNWSPQDVWLATCSVDNTITIWNALQFPEQVAVLKGHTGLVKGVTWDPLGKYLASQSDDRTLRVWRTLDWQLEKVISKPFEECGGTTHTLRLNWSPDGHHIVSAHAMNNSGPTAQIIQRESFNASLDFVGHRKAVTVVRFNPNILKKQLKGSKSQNYSCCAIGSKDRSLSIWLTALKRPLVVMHDLFENSILDVSWSQSGLELMSCSIDGSVAFMDFTTEEIGQALSKEEVVNMLETIYGKGVSLHDTATKKSQIIESAAMLNLQQQQQEQQQQRRNGDSNLLTPSKNSNMSMSHMSASGDNTPFKPTDKQIETRTADGRRRITPIFLAPQPEVGEVPLPFNSNSNIEFHSSSEKSKIVVEKQNRVTVPGMLSPNSGSKSMSSMPSPPSQVNPSTAPQPVVVRDIMGLNSTKVTQSQKAVNEKTPEKEPMQTEPSPRLEPSTPSAISELSKTPTTTPSEKIKATEKPKLLGKDKTGERDKEDSIPSGKDKDKLKSRLSSGKLALKKYRYGKRGRPSKSDQAAREAALAAAAAEVMGGPIRSDPTQAHTSATPTVSMTGAGVAATSTVAVVDKSRVLFSGPVLDLPEMTIGKSTSKVIEGPTDRSSENSMVLEVENGVDLGTTKVHKLRCLRGPRCVWEHLLTSKICALAGSRHVLACACVDGTVTTLTSGGRRLLPALVVGASPSFFACTGHFLLAVTTRGHLYVWNCQTLKVEIKSESLAEFMTEKDRVEEVILTPQGVPLLTLSSGKSYSFSTDIGCWVLASGGDDGLQVNSNYQQSVPSKSRPLGPLNSLQKHFRLREQVPRASQSTPGVQHWVTVSHLESQVSSSLALRSASEFRFWLETYIRYLAREGMEEKLREVCDDLLGPLYKSRKAKPWSQHVLGIDKHSVLRTVLPYIGSHLNLQRLYTEYNEQLEMVTTGGSAT